jgi:hypothetical protein
MRFYVQQGCVPVNGLHAIKKRTVGGVFHAAVPGGIGPVALAVLYQVVSTISRGFGMIAFVYKEFGGGVVGGRGLVHGVFQVGFGLRFPSFPLFNSLLVEYF